MSAAEIVYLLCAATSVACAILLLRGYWKSRARLLLWSSLCFVGLGLNNVLLYVDMVMLPNVIDFSLERLLPALIGLSFLLYGLIWDTE
ncbi:DUF5985 family protein [Thermithiobacillus plumbiphilus]|uniref:DUF5985 family protein n=1 Tax=Thermithiobacillus plumbiphilus TaxID=1729899 RepID=A0ABU9D4Q1_9PROT